ncbi:MAG: hypothetical protein AAF462_04520, partial [Thermodesulfobacteriota bacterium]
GGCSDSDSNQVDARTIGSIEGALVPALNKRLNLKEWQEGDPDGDLYLNGSRVASLSDAEKQAVNNAYQMGYLVGLTNAEIDHILDMHEVLGLNPVFADNGTLDLLAFSREFNVSGIRYFILRPYQDGPIPENINLGRVDALDDWAQISSSAISLSQAELRETGGLSELTSLADSTSWTEHGTWTAAIDTNIPGSVPDLQVTLTGFAQAWSVHSTADNNDFYYLRTNFVLTPTSKDGTLGAVCNELCDAFNITGCPGPGALASEIGVVQYTLNNTQPTFNNSELFVIEFNPTTTTGEVTTSSSISHTFSDNVSYSQDDGAEVGVSSSSTYSHSTSYESPAVTTTAEISGEQNMNNAQWSWLVENSNVSKATFEPNFQWIWEATPATRVSGLVWEQAFNFFAYAYSCAPPRTNTTIPVLKMAIPNPPLPKQCSANSDCGTGQVCATDLSPAICVAQPCDEMMLCPDGFQCMNEECQPSSG